MNPETKSALTIAAFESGRIDADTFDHAAHVYVAWLYVGRYTLPEALERFTSALRRLTRELGVPQKYHETITWFFLLLIAERRASTGDDWQAFKRRNCDLFRRDDNVLSHYYSTETLASDRARTRFVLPDRRYLADG